MGYFLLQPLFPLGDLLCSFGVTALGIDLTPYIWRHQTGDWGDLSSEDLEDNRLAVTSNDAILSKYHLTTPDGISETICLMTEKDRPYTVIFMLGEALDMPDDE